MVFIGRGEPLFATPYFVGFALSIKTIIRREDAVSLWGIGIVFVVGMFR